MFSEWLKKSEHKPEGYKPEGYTPEGCKLTQKELLELRKFLQNA